LLRGLHSFVLCWHPKCAKWCATRRNTTENPSRKRELMNFTRTHTGAETGWRFTHCPMCGWNRHGPDHSSIDRSAEEHECCPKEKARYWRAAGRFAYNNGEPRVPILNRTVFEAITGLPVGDGAAEIMKAFLHGWDEANLSAPLPCEPASDQHRPADERDRS
jgi:hypothetical protein